MLVEGLSSLTDRLFPWESLRDGSGSSSPMKALPLLKFVLDFEPQFMKYFSGSEYWDEKISSREEIWRSKSSN